MISKRASALINSPSEIVEAHIKCLKDPFNLENPNGYLNFGTAQNYLMTDEIKVSLKWPLELSENELHYNEAYGLEWFRKILGDFLCTRLHIEDVKFENIVVQTGASAICESLSFTLFDEGDGLLIPTPYYIGFNHDFAKRFNVKIIKSHMLESESFRLNSEIIEGDIKTALNSGVNLKAILLTNPHNPTGTLRESREIKKIINLAKKYNLQIICDEIYALSCFGDNQFKSILNFAKDYRDNIHFIYGMAKDFTLSGFKVGVYYTENSKALEAMQAASYFHTVSTHTQKYIGNLLSNNNYLDSFIEKNNKRIKQNFERLKSELKFDILTVDSGIFCMINLKSLLSTNTFEAELELFNNIFNEYKVSITPGQFFSCNSPGWFRACYAMNSDAIEEFIERVNSL
jgi:1-aminocyclopropane-1-carboxylate synthase